MVRRLLVQSLCVLTFAVAVTAPAAAQARPPTRPPERNTIGVRGFGMVGNMIFKAEDSFDTVLDTHSGPIFGGGGQVLLPWNIYVEIGAWRFKDDGERVFIAPNSEIFKLGVPVEVTVIPLEVTGGYRFTGIARKFVPYAGIGYSSYRYEETSEHAEASEDVDERFGGFHILGGGEYQITPWLALGGEVAWSAIADSIGQSGVSAHFNEDDLGGTSFRLKVSIGR